MSLKILVIDDDRSFGVLLRKLLEAEVSKDVHISSSGEDGIALCTQIKPDIVFLDMRLGSMTGDQVARHISMNTENRPKIVGITGHLLDDLELNPHLKNSGISFLVQKPMDLFELSDLLKNSVQRCMQLTL